MPKYSAVFTEHHQVSVIFRDEFDTSDKEKWEWLKSSVESEMEDSDFLALPAKPPKDPKAWFALYQLLPETEYEDKEDDWITVRKGGYDISRELVDAKGKVLESE